MSGQDYYGQGQGHGQGYGYSHDGAYQQQPQQQHGYGEHQQGYPPQDQYGQGHHSPYPQGQVSILAQHGRIQYLRLQLLTP